MQVTKAFTGIIACVTKSLLQITIPAQCYSTPLNPLAIRYSNRKSFQHGLLNTFRFRQALTKGYRAS